MKKNNCVDGSLIVGEESHEHLQCCICLEFMINPFEADCQASAAKHVFGINCIERWIAKLNGKKECPLCREKFQVLESSKTLLEEAKKFNAKCKACSLIFPAIEINAHLQTCPNYLEHNKQKLAKIVNQQIQQLQKEINPHLRESHAAIYEKYVQEWKWLHYDLRNWKWWWWCNNPWWENKSCPTCNTLWHKYEKEIDELESKRIAMLMESQPEEEKNQEKVEYQNG